MHARSTPSAKTYDTRLDKFRVREGIAIEQWAEEAKMSRTQFNKYRANELQPRVSTLAKLARSGSRLLRRRVRASELYDLGEDTPLGGGGGQSFRSSNTLRGRYNSPFDRLLRQIKMSPSAAARLLCISRVTIREIREPGASPKIGTVRRIVVALRRCGYDVKTSDIADVGET